MVATWRHDGKAVIELSGILCLCLNNDALIYSQSMRPKVL